MTEVWAAVNGYEHSYAISNLGRVKSLARKRRCKLGSYAVMEEKIIDGEVCANRGGHIRVSLSRSGKKAARRFVHNIVLTAFVGSCPEGMQCRHLDGDPLNNRLSNLAWGTPRENSDDRIAHGRMIRATFATNTSGHRGVSFERRLGKWHAYIGYEPRKNIGWFDTFEEACAARLSAEVGWEGSRPESIGAQDGL